MKCPSCGYDNIPGVDVCEKCMAPIADAYISFPKDKFSRMIMNETVWNAIDKGQKPVLLDIHDSVEKAVKAFQEKKQSCLLVVDRNKLAGIVTYRDILRKVAGKCKDMSRLSVSKIMTDRPVTLHKEDTVAVAINRMSVCGVRHIPIVDDNNKPVGWISVKAVIRHLSRSNLSPASS